MGMFDEIIYEVDLREKTTGNSVETIYSGTDDSIAYGIADDWNAEHGNGRLQEDYESYDELRFKKNNPNEHLYADVIHVEEPSEVHGIGKYVNPILSH